MSSAACLAYHPTMHGLPIKRRLALVPEHQMAFGAHNMYESASTFNVVFYSLLFIAPTVLPQNRVIALAPGGMGVSSTNSLVEFVAS